MEPETAHSLKRKRPRSIILGQLFLPVLWLVGGWGLLLIHLSTGWDPFDAGEGSSTYLYIAAGVSLFSMLYGARQLRTTLILMKRGRVVEATICRIGRRASGMRRVDCTFLHNYLAVKVPLVLLDGKHAYGDSILLIFDPYHPKRAMEASEFYEPENAASDDVR